MKYNKIQVDPHILDGLLDDENSCVEVHKKYKQHVTLLPYHLNNLKENLRSILDVGISKYNKKYNGILLAHKNVRVLPTKSIINREYVHVHMDIEADVYIFKPEVGRLLNGVIIECSSGHVGALVYNTFSVSIPKPESDTSDYEWLGWQVTVGQEVELRIRSINYEAQLPHLIADLITIKEVPSIKSEPDDSQVKVKKKKKKSKDLCEESIDNNAAEEIVDKKVKKHKKIKEEDPSIAEFNFTDENGVEEIKSSKKKKSKRDKSLQENNLDALTENVTKKKKSKSKGNSFLGEEADISGITKLEKTFCESDLEVTESNEDVTRKKKKKEKKEHSLIEQELNYENNPSVKKNKIKHKNQEVGENDIKVEDLSFDSNNSLNFDDLIDDNTSKVSQSSVGMIDDDVKKLKNRRSSTATDNFVVNFKKEIIYDSEIETMMKDSNFKSSETKKRKRSSIVNNIEDIKWKKIKTEH